MMREFADATTARALGLTTLWRRLERVTPFARDIRPRFFPPGEAKQLEAQWKQVEQAVEKLESGPGSFASLRHRLAQVKDIRPSVERAVRGFTLDVVELFEIKSFLGSLRDIRGHATAGLWPGSKDMVPPDPARLAQVLDPQGKNEASFHLDAGFSPALGRLEVLKKRLKGRLDQEKQRLSGQVEAELGVPLGLGGELVLPREDVKLERAWQLPQLVLERETSSHLFFKVRSTPAALIWEERYTRLREWEERIEEKVRQRLSQAVASEASALGEAVDCLRRLDLLLATAILCREWRGVRPRLNGDRLELVEGRHPLVEEEVCSRGYAYSPISLTMEAGVTVITGPNMGGKTQTLRTVGLMVALAQHGFLVPASSFAFPPRSFLFYGAGQACEETGLSAFAQEIEGIKGLLSRRHQPGLALVDEFARSTNPKEGRALAGALAALLGESDVFTLLVTHFDGLGQSSRFRQYQVRGLRAREVPALGGVDSLHRCMDYRLERVEPGAPVPHYALEDGRLLGLDEELLTRARAFLREEEATCRW